MFKVPLLNVQTIYYTIKTCVAFPYTIISKIPFIRFLFIEKGQISNILLGYQT